MDAPPPPRSARARTPGEDLTLMLKKFAGALRRARRDVARYRRLVMITRAALRASRR